MLKSIATLPQNRMNAETTSTLFSVTLLKDEALDEIAVKLKEDFTWKVFGARCPENFKIDNRVRLFVCSELVESPAEIMLYLHAMYDDARKRNKLDSLYTLNDFCYLFAMGFPSRDYLAKAWDEQKCTRGEGSVTDNLIDNVDNW